MLYVIFTGWVLFGKQEYLLSATNPPVYMMLLLTRFYSSLNIFFVFLVLYLHLSKFKNNIAKFKS